MGKVKITSKGTTYQGQSICPCLNTKINVHADRVGRFRAYLRHLRQTFIVLRHRYCTRFKVVGAFWRSRYFPEGRLRIKRYIFKRLGRWAYVPGVLLTVTYDPKRITLEEAWANYGAHTRAFLNALNQHRWRKGWKRRLSYIWVVEPHKGTGYPHIHVFFPYLKWLADKDYIAGLWGRGRTNVIGRRTVHVASYICKYITKFSGWSEDAQAFIWEYRGRLYSVSRCFYMPVQRYVSEWRFFAVVYSQDIHQLAYNLRGAGLFGYSLDVFDSS